MQHTKANIIAVAQRIADGLTIDQAAKETCWERSIDDEQVLLPIPDEWRVVDDGGHYLPAAWKVEEDDPLIYYARNSQVAAELLSDELCDWEDIYTDRITVRIWREGINGAGEIVRADECIYIIQRPKQVHPCEDGQEHDWQEPRNLIGDSDTTSFCMRCGTERVKNTWITDPDTGLAVLIPVSYDPEKWQWEVAARREG